MAVKREDLFLVFDAGTQSVRAGLVDLCGSMADFVKVPFEPYFSERKGWAELDPEKYWDSFCQASRQLLGRNAALVPRIRALAVSPQRGTYINLGHDGKPLRPAITWLDERMTPRFRWAPWYLEAAMKALGWYGNLDKTVRRAGSNWVRQCQPEIWEKTWKYVLMSAYLNYRLTGEMVESLGCNFGYLPVNRRTNRWADNGDLIWMVFPMEPDKLPGLAPQGGILGTINREASGVTGIPAGLPLIATAGDKQCEVLGAGCVDSSVACLSFGTCSAINTVTHSYVELKPNFIPYPAAMPGWHSPEISVIRGFWMVTWFKEQFGQIEQQAAAQKGVPAERLLDDMIKDVPPGSHGLVLQPYWSPHLWMTGEEARGSVIGFTAQHTRAHLYRAILEGIMYGLKEGGDIMTGKLKKPFTKLRACGGGSQSRAVLQLASDVFNLPVENLEVFETGSIGAAINAAVGLGYYPDYPSAATAMTRVNMHAEPLPRNVEIYYELYRRVYRKMYRRVGPLFEDLLDMAEKFPAEMK